MKEESKEIQIRIYKCGDGLRYWTYRIMVGSQFVKVPELIHRMYSRRKTAVNNAFKFYNTYNQ